MRNPHGQISWHGPAATSARDTFTCPHCNGITIVEAKAPVSDSGGWCFQCAAMVCKSCAGKDCVPFERKLEQMEARGAMLRSMGIG